MQARLFIIICLYASLGYSQTFHELKSITREIIKLQETDSINIYPYYKNKKLDEYLGNLLWKYGKKMESSGDSLWFLNGLRFDIELHGSLDSSGKYSFSPGIDTSQTQFVTFDDYSYLEKFDKRRFICFKRKRDKKMPSLFLSTPVLSVDKRYCIIYEYYYFGPLAASGGYSIYQKIGGKWYFRDAAILVIS